MTDPPASTRNTAVARRAAKFLARMRIRVRCGSGSGIDETLEQTANLGLRLADAGATLNAASSRTSGVRRREDRRPVGGAVDDALGRRRHADGVPTRRLASERLDGAGRPGARAPSGPIQ